MTLVVTADDLGLSPGVTKGILESHRRGVVRSASLVVTFAAAEEAAALARAEHDLEVGLHLDLVGGGPIADPASIPSLCDDDGRFHPLAEFARRLAIGRIRAHELAAEVRAQVALARRWGVPALAWDSHRHVHLMPPVARVVSRVAREEGVRWVRRGTAPRWPGAKGAAIHAASWRSSRLTAGWARSVRTPATSTPSSGGSIRSSPSARRISRSSPTRSSAPRSTARSAGAFRKCRARARAARSTVRSTGTAPRRSARASSSTGVHSFPTWRSSSATSRVPGSSSISAAGMGSSPASCVRPPTRDASSGSTSIRTRSRSRGARSATRSGCGSRWLTWSPTRRRSATR
ncbi:MAG: ChbG/HpnK family deacetylase [Chloroflexi bacterium]|nr:MAG: ChbG/HpnK family deacetylase [Chloroflexota bacterium]